MSLHKLKSVGSLLAQFAIFTSCLSVSQLNSCLEEPQINIGLEEPVAKPFPHISIPSGIELDSIFYPTGFPTQSFSYKTGVIVIPLVIYNRFQSNYLITLGAKQFTRPLNDAFKERFRVLMSACTDSTKTLQNRFTLTMDMQSCEVEGIYVRGFWGMYYLYGASTYEIDHGRNAFSFVRIRWELSRGDDPVLAGNVTVTLKDPYAGSIVGFLVANGHRSELTKDDLTFGLPFQIEFGYDANLNQAHINRMVQVMCLTMDKASEVILGDINHFFAGQGIEKEVK